ncbi:Hypothetical predicted protein [Octopus vulgaris]|uniref:Uncharacterized protein n=1 Tax=Octopus vulgaris TaxID=6645 RepID=A0AA36BSD1_OCTVU|nr:Hypothetical predicted protein [Octopus vulgaris]
MSSTTIASTKTAMISTDDTIAHVSYDAVMNNILAVVRDFADFVEVTDVHKIDGFVDVTTVDAVTVCWQCYHCRRHHCHVFNNNDINKNSNTILIIQAKKTTVS